MNASEAEESDGDEAMEDTLGKRVKVNKNERYIPVDFIHRSSSEVERLWSTAKHVLSEQRGSMNPVLFEAILCLKYNSSFWNEHIVAAAVYAYVSRKVKQRLDEPEKQIEFIFGELQFE